MKLAPGQQALIGLLDKVLNLLTELESPEGQSVPIEERPAHTEAKLHEVLKEALRDPAFSDYVSEVMWELNQEGTKREA